MRNFYGGEATDTLDLQSKMCPLPPVALIDALPNLKKGELLAYIYQRNFFKKDLKS